MSVVIPRKLFNEQYKQLTCPKREIRKRGDWIWYPPCVNKNNVSFDSRLVSVEESKLARVPLTGASYILTSIADNHVEMDKCTSKFFAGMVKARKNSRRKRR